MSDIAIRVENLSKQYRIGGKGVGYHTFREALLDSFAAPVRWMRGERKPIETFWALEDVSFEVKQGEALGIIGRNGAGKSTLLKILSRITKPTKGRVDLYGRVASLLEVGTGFHSELSGRDNIYLNGAILGMSRREIERKFDEIVDFSGVEKFLDTPVKHYSSGMYVRLAFTVAAHLEPEILVVDEVLAVGDAEFQKRCFGKMNDVAREGRTVLFVSHNTAAIRNLCTACILLSKGEVIMNGQVEAVINRYLHSATLNFPSNIELPRMDEGTPGTGKSLQIMSQDGTPNSSFKLGEPWKVVYEFEMFKSTEQVSAGFHLVNSEYVTVMTFMSAPKDLDPGCYYVEFQVDTPLASSDLHFSAALWSHDHTIYFQSNIDGVSIIDAAVGKRPRLSTSAHGVIITSQNEIIRKVK